MHVGAVLADREISDAECQGNCAAIVAAGDQGKDFPLSRGQAGDIRACHPHPPPAPPAGAAAYALGAAEKTS